MKIPPQQTPEYTEVDIYNIFPQSLIDTLDSRVA